MMAKICIDPGHGGSDPGACGYGRQEKADVLSVALKVGAMVEGKGHSVYYTRTNDIFESPYQKAAEANSVGADFFASFHRNAALVSAHGYETWVYSNTGKAKACADRANSEMAAVGFTNRGTKIGTDLIVLNSTVMEAVLFEIGFITNEGDNNLFTSKFDAICVGLANAILAAVGGGTVSGSDVGAGGAPEKIPTVPGIGGQTELGHVDCMYRAYAAGVWWPQVRNREDWAGKGDNEPIRYLGICVSKGSIKGRVYTQASGWLPYLTFTNSYNINDLVNGVLGDGSPILAVELYYYTPEGYLYKEVHYCVSVQGNEAFYAKQIDNKVGAGFDGYAGDKVNFIDKLQAWIE